jgi:hypothetical protein
MGRVHSYCIVHGNVWKFKGENHVEHSNCSVTSPCKSPQRLSHGRVGDICSVKLVVESRWHRGYFANGHILKIDLFWNTITYAFSCTIPSLASLNGQCCCRFTRLLVRCLSLFGPHMVRLSCTNQGDLTTLSALSSPLSSQTPTFPSDGHPLKHPYGPGDNPSLAHHAKNNFAEGSGARLFEFLLCTASQDTLDHPLLAPILARRTALQIARSHVETRPFLDAKTVSGQSLSIETSGATRRALAQDKLLSRPYPKGQFREYDMSEVKVARGEEPSHSACQRDWPDTVLATRRARHEDGQVFLVRRGASRKAASHSLQRKCS